MVQTSAHPGQSSVPHAFFVHVDVEASVGLLAFAAADTETAHAAFVGQGETSWSRNHAGDFALVVQVAVVFEVVDDVGDREPQTLAPVAGLAESWASLFFDLDALSALFIGLERVAATLATAVFLDAVAFRHHLQKVLVRFTAPIGDIGTESASLERFGEHSPTAADHWSWRHIANLTEFGACGLLAIDRQASFLAITCAASELETALAASFGHDETSGHEIGEAPISARRIELHIACCGDVLTHGVDGKPQALIRPLVPRAESRAFRSGRSRIGVEGVLID